MHSTQNQSRIIVRAAVVFEGGLALLALILGSWLRLSRTPLEQIHWTAIAAGWGLLAAVPLVAGLLILVRWPIGPFKTIEEITRKLLLPMFAGCSVAELLGVSALAGIGEELLFRGVIQQGVEQYCGSQWQGLAIASLAFGLAHPITKTYAVLAGLIGAYLGWLLQASDNLLVPIITHAAYDFAALVYLLRRHEPTEQTADSNPL